MKQVDELVNEILTIVRTLSEQEMASLSGDTLSRLAVKLASYKASLGEYVSEVKKASWDAEAAYKNKRALEYKRLRDEGKGSTDSEAMKEIGAYEERMAWNEARRQESTIVTLSMDCHDLIDGIKSRLINLQTERSEGSVY